MKFTKETIDRIMAVLNDRLGQEKSVCAVCQHTQWTVSVGYVFLPLQDEPGNVQIGGRGLPLLPLTCTTCGNTLFFNLVALGLGDLLETDKKTETEERSAKETSVK